MIRVHHCRSVRTRLQVSTCSCYDMCRPG